MSDFFKIKKKINFYKQFHFNKLKYPIPNLKIKDKQIRFLLINMLI